MSRLALPRHLCTEFRRGLLSPDPLVPAFSLLLLLLALASAELLLRRHALDWIPEAWMLSSSSDDFGHLLYRVHQLRQTPLGAPALYLVGSSRFRDAFDPEESLSPRLPAIGGRAPALVKLAAPLFPLRQNLLALELMAVAPGSMVVIELSTLRLLEHRGLLGRKRRRNEWAFLPFSGNLNWRSGIAGFVQPSAILGVLDRLRSKWGEKSSLSHLLSPQVYREGSPDPDEAGRRLDRREHFSRVLEMSMSFPRRYLEDTQQPFAAIRELGALARKRGFRLVFLEAPLSPLGILKEGELGIEINQVLTPFLRNVGAEYWNFRDQLGLAEDDFEDLMHLRPAGREKFQREFLRRLDEAPGRRGGDEK